MFWTRYNERGLVRGEKFQCGEPGCGRMVGEDALQERADGLHVCRVCFRRPVKRAKMEHTAYKVGQRVLWRRTVQNKGRTLTIEAEVIECRDKVLVLQIDEGAGPVLRRAPYETVMPKPA